MPNHWPDFNSDSDDDANKEGEDDGMNKRGKEMVVDDSDSL